MTREEAVDVVAVTLRRNHYLFRNMLEPLPEPGEDPWDSIAREIAREIVDALGARASDPEPGPVLSIEQRQIEVSGVQRRVYDWRVEGLEHGASVWGTARSMAAAHRGARRTVKQLRRTNRVLDRRLPIPTPLPVVVPGVEIDGVPVADDGPRRPTGRPRWKVDP